MNKRHFYAKCIQESKSGMGSHKLGKIYLVEYHVKPENYDGEVWLYACDDRNYSYRTFTTFNHFSNYFEIVYNLTEEDLKEIQKNYSFPT